MGAKVKKKKKYIVNYNKIIYNKTNIFLIKH